MVHSTSGGRRALWILLFALLVDAELSAQQEVPEPEELVELDLKSLMNIEVTSVSRRPERLSDAAASIFVITADDIRRSGATSLPEALRLAPSLHVVQSSASAYGVSARGFASSAANKMLVLIDGRPVYSPLFSGVFWDVQDVMLEHIERIEVVSGPGGTLWGVNAVNGVINIITRSATKTRGGLVMAGFGNREAIGALRYGHSMGPDGDYRVYGKYFDRKHTETAAGVEKDDAWHKGQIGFRADWERAADQVTFVAAAYDGTEGQPLPGTIVTGAQFTLGDISISGLNLTGRWKRRLDNNSSVSVQAYFDRTERNVRPTFAEKLNIFDLQFLHSFRVATVHTVSWGAEYRYGMDRVTNSPYIAFLPAHLNQRWAAVFAQGEFLPRPDVRLTIGLRSERNDYTGNEFLPNMRVAWNVADDHLLWGAASRTVRAPSRLDRDTFVPATPPFLLAGGPDVVSEVANVFELGYRGQPMDSLTFSATVFHAHYDRLRTQEIAPSRTSLFFANGMRGTTTGAELWGSYQAMKNWRLSAGFSALEMDLELEPWSNDTATLLAQSGADPERSWRLRSALDLPRNIELDLTARYVSALSNPTVPAYTAVDVRCGWRPSPRTEVWVTGTNLFDGGHGEFTAEATRTEIGRGIFVGFTRRFGEGS